jgi:hypothetical protein
MVSSDASITAYERRERLPGMRARMNIPRFSATLAFAD